MNIECTQAALDELTAAFRFNDAVLRNLVIARDEAVSDPSPLAKQKDDGDGERRSRRGEGGDGGDSSSSREASSSGSGRESSSESSGGASSDSASAS